MKKLILISLLCVFMGLQSMGRDFGKPAVIDTSEVRRIIAQHTLFRDPNPTWQPASERIHRKIGEALGAGYSATRADSLRSGSLGLWYEASRSMLDDTLDGHRRTVQRCYCSLLLALVADDQHYGSFTEDALSALSREESPEEHYAKELLLVYLTHYYLSSVFGHYVCDEEIGETYRICRPCVADESFRRDMDKLLGE